jgi:hypothetical protein
MPFKVILMIPLVPAFEADLAEPQASSVRIIMQAQYSSLCKGPTSLMALLSARNIPIDDYLLILSLRTYTTIQSKESDAAKVLNFITEQIYIHSKLLIVDDCRAILGSANINDRSLVGDKDGEIATYLEEEKPNKILFLRLRLWQEHLGLEHPNSIIDPVTAFDLIRKVASNNTVLYRRLFKCLPDDTVVTWSAYHAFSSQLDSLDNSESTSQYPPQPSLLSDAHAKLPDYSSLPSLSLMLRSLSIEDPFYDSHRQLYDLAVSQLRRIQGHVVLFPTHFLENEEIGASFLSKEYLLPSEVYH